MVVNAVKISEIVRIITEKYGTIEKIILFGSQVRGDIDEYSDTDLIVIKKTKKGFVERLADFPPLPAPADVFVYTPEEFEKMKSDENPFIMNALEHSQVIYEKL